MIFKLTVLETYWEFEARIGTVVKLTVSTFVPTTLFFCSFPFFARKKQENGETLHDPLFRVDWFGSQRRNEESGVRLGDSAES